MGHGHVTPNPDGVKARCGGPGLCAVCNQEAADAGFYGADGPPEKTGVCSKCGQPLPDGELKTERATEAGDPDPADGAPEEGAAEGDVGTGAWVSWRASGGTLKGRVSSVHKSSTVPGVTRKVVGTSESPAARIKIYEKDGDGWKASGRYTAMPVSDLKSIDALPEPAAAEAINGKVSANDIRELLCAALEDRVKRFTGRSWAYVYVIDFTTDDVVYASGDDKKWQAPYTLSGNVVTIGEPIEVIATTVYQPVDDGSASGEVDGAAAAEGAPAAERARVDGRVVEAKGTGADGGRIFRVRMIAYGESKNGRRYPEAVMREAVSLYDGAKVYDHHRTPAELQSSTINGMVGSMRSPTAEADGLYADLHLLPSATKAGEVLDASLSAQESELPPLAGLSHDVLGLFKNVVDGGRRLAEAAQITQVHSVDIVANPAAGGRAERAVAGGETETGTAPANTEEDAVPTTVEEILGALKEATPEQLAAAGLTKAAEADKKPDDTTGDTTGEKAAGVVEAKTDGHPKDSFVGRLLIKSAVEAAGLPAPMIESVTGALGDTITEADVDAQIAAVKTMLGTIEKAGLTPQAGAVTVTQEARDKKTQALDNFFASHAGARPTEGAAYRSFKQAYIDITGRQPKSWDEDFNRVLLRESIGTSGGFDSSIRAEESLTTASWDQLLGDSITRRMVAEYGRPSLQTWRRIVSSMPPVNDFRTQRIGRVGGYGTLPAVNQGAPYQPLTSPTDEEATYAITKRGGTEDLTLEMIANDDVRAISNIPFKLGLAAAQTLYRFVWDLLATNVTATYDSTALFHANHANTDTSSALSQTTLSVGRRKMRKQASYGDSSDVLSIIPRLLVVPSELEELAFQLCTSAVAVPATPAGPSDTPNLHSGTEFEVIDYWTDTNDWFLVGDPSLCPTVEIGFYQGREQPELFTQADPSVGSVFNADTITYKIRHIYSGTALDHRAFYRGVG